MEDIFRRAHTLVLIVGRILLWCLLSHCLYVYRRQALTMHA